ncbi:MAG: hypothetical protein NC177_04815 [Ruminococcus flavefaciens]|nr:hypothetical protein [Ruminococcus flavefaciens]
MEILVVTITLAVITGVGLLIFLAGRAIFEFIVDHACLKFIVIGLFALALADMFGPEIVLIVGGILLIKPVIYGLGWLLSPIWSNTPSDPMTCVYPKRTEEDDEIFDFDTYEDMFGNKYRYDRRYGELIDKNHQRIKVSQVYEHDLELKDSKGYPYDRIN